jgi:hypothetical protein
MAGRNTLAEKNQEFETSITHPRRNIEKQVVIRVQVRVPDWR